MRDLLVVAVILLFAGSLAAQEGKAVDLSESVSRQLIGHWEGAVIKGNSSQSLEVEVYKRNGKLMSLQVLREWWPAFGDAGR